MTPLTNAQLDLARLRSRGCLPSAIPLAITHHFAQMEGWCRDSKGVRLAELVVATAAPLSVELGVFGGRGTLALALGHQFLGVGYVVGIDPWTRAAALEGTNTDTDVAWWSTLDIEGIYRKAVDAMGAAGVSPHWQFQRLRSQDAAHLFPDRTIRLLHQDANHSEETSSEEVRLYAPKMTLDSLWVVDDAKWASTQLAQHLLVREYGYRLVEEYEDWAVYQGPGAEA